MSSQPIHAPTRSSSRDLVRYSLCVLASAIAWAFALDNILQELWLLARDILAGAHPTLYPKSLDEERLTRFKAVGGNPFTMADDPADLFADLR